MITATLQTSNRKLEKVLLFAMNEFPELSIEERVELLTLAGDWFTVTAGLRLDLSSGRIQIDDGPAVVIKEAISSSVDQCPA